MLGRFIFSNVYVVYFICLLPVIVAFITFVRCYRMIHEYNRYEDWVRTPLVSAIGIVEPERTVFQYGCTILWISIILVHYTFSTRLMIDKRIIIANKSLLNVINTKKLLNYLNSYMYIISAGVPFQAWVNADYTFSRGIYSSKIQETPVPIVVIIHTAAAIIWFVGFIVYHCIIVLSFNYETKGLLYSYYYKLFITAMGVLFGTAILSFFLVFAIDPYKNQDLFHFLVNFAGICMYTAAATIVLFMASYVWDYCILLDKQLISSKKEE